MRKPPIHIHEIHRLFGALDVELLRKDCDNTLHKSQRWLEQRGHDAASVLAWLRAHGGYCDCEVLLNVDFKLNGERDA
jgi:hypothetical protein